MKVICIDNSNPVDKTELSPENWIWEGEVYTVSGKRKENGILYYYLDERSFFTYGPIYKASRFRIIDTEPVIEKEMIENRTSTF